MRFMTIMFGLIAGFQRVGRVRRNENCRKRSASVADLEQE